MILQNETNGGKKKSLLLIKSIQLKTPGTGDLQISKKTENNLQNHFKLRIGALISSDLIKLNWLKTCGMKRDLSRKMGKVKMPLSFQEGKIDNYYLPVIYQRFKGVGKFIPFHKTPFLRP